MAIQYCQKCQKEVTDGQAVIRNYLYYCPTCHSQLVYFGKEDVQVAKGPKEVKDKSQILAEFKGDMTPFERHVGSPPEVLSSQDLLRRDPKNQKALLFLAHYFKSISNIKESLNYYDQLIEHYPDNPSIYQEKAGLQMDGKDYAGAIDTLTALSEKDPQNYFVFYNLGLAYFHNNQLRSAISAFEEAYTLTQDPAEEAAISKIIEQLTAQL